MTATSKPFPTTTAYMIRLCLFQPTRRPKMLRRARIETPWGTVLVTGRLGQQHADIFEAICYEHEKKAVLEDGRIKLLVDPARVRRRSDITSGEQFEDVLQDLRMVDIKIIEPKRLACAGHLIDHIDMAVRSDGTPITRPNPLGGGERPLWRVELGKVFSRLVFGDVWLRYDPHPITQLPHGVSQAVARHVLTHKTQPNGGWLLDGLIQAVHGGTLDSVQIRNRRRELRADAERLREIGIVIDGDRVRRE